MSAKKCVACGASLEPVVDESAKATEPQPVNDSTTAAVSSTSPSFSGGTFFTASNFAVPTGPTTFGTNSASTVPCPTNETGTAEATAAFNDDGTPPLPVSSDVLPRTTDLDAGPVPSTSGFQVDPVPIISSTGGSSRNSTASASTESTGPAPSSAPPADASPTTPVSATRHVLSGPTNDVIASSVTATGVAGSAPQANVAGSAVSNVNVAPIFVFGSAAAPAPSASNNQFGFGVPFGATASTNTASNHPAQAGPSSTTTTGYLDGQTATQRMGLAPGATPFTHTAVNSLYDNDADMESAEDMEMEIDMDIDVDGGANAATQTQWVQAPPASMSNISGTSAPISTLATPGMNFSHRVPAALTTGPHVTASNNHFATYGAGIGPVAASFATVTGQNQTSSQGASVRAFATSIGTSSQSMSVNGSLQQSSVVPGAPTGASGSAFPTAPASNFAGPPHPPAVATNFAGPTQPLADVPQLFCMGMAPTRKSRNTGASTRQVQRRRQKGN